MEHLYLMDDDNFLYEHMANLRPGVVDLIQRNYGHEIEMYTIEQGEKRDKRQ